MAQVLAIGGDEQHRADHFRRGVFGGVTQFRQGFIQGPPGAMLSRSLA
jgi:hypothetical protein